MHVHYSQVQVQLSLKQRQSFVKRNKIKSSRISNYWRRDIHWSSATNFISKSHYYYNFGFNFLIAVHRKFTTVAKMKMYYSWDTTVESVEIRLIIIVTNKPDKFHCFTLLSNISKSRSVIWVLRAPPYTVRFRLCDFPR